MKLCLGIIFLLFLSCLALPLTDGDTAYYGKIARNILETGDWITLRFKGDALVDKPPITWLLFLYFFPIFINNTSVRIRGIQIDYPVKCADLLNLVDMHLYLQRYKRPSFNQAKFNYSTFLLN